MLRIEFLGTGGAIGIPRPACDCRICAEARGRGVPYSRGGPSLFVHGPDLLIDTPEDIVPNLNRAGIRHVGAVTWSHWHPDHTAGMRVFEPLNFTTSWPPEHACTPVYLPAGVREDFDRFHGLGDRLNYYAALRLIAPAVIPEGESFALNGATITPYRLPDPSVQAYAFILEEGRKRVFIAPDELFSWQPDPALGHFDLAILQAGLMDVHPLTGEQIFPVDHPVLQREASFADTLDMIRALDADRVILTHLFMHGIASYDELLVIQRTLMQQHPELGNVMFAFDRLSVMP
ncbi:MAG: hypothetical protein JXN59_18470 [Anaerolineae bacterium]|nr:hypothetical protein [Anaerolineae bacterium]